MRSGRIFGQNQILLDIRNICIDSYLILNWSCSVIQKKMQNMVKSSCIIFQLYVKYDITRLVIFLTKFISIISRLYFVFFLSKIVFLHSFCNAAFESAVGCNKGANATERVLPLTSSVDQVWFLVVHFNCFICNALSVFCRCRFVSSKCNSIFHHRWSGARLCQGCGWLRCRFVYIMCITSSANEFCNT